MITSVDLRPQLIRLLRIGVLTPAMVGLRALVGALPGVDGQLLS